MSRYDDDTPRRGRLGGRDDDRPTRERERSRDDGDDARGSGTQRGRDDDDRGGRRATSSRAGGSFSYEARTADQARRRSEQGGNDFDKILVDTVKMWKPNDGNNTIRPLPPTWKKPEHYGYDIYVHYGVGPDRQSYLCPQKMKSEPCPICEERVEAQRHGDEKYAKELEAKKRVLTFLIDRDHEKDGVQAWAMPWTVDRDIVKVSTDRRTGAVLPIDHPEEGFDILFEKKGAKDRTEYLGIAVDRRDSPLGKAEWLDFAMDHPLPDQLQFFDYDHIAKAFNGGGKSAPRRSDDDRGDEKPASRLDTTGTPARGRDDADDRLAGRRDDLPGWEEVHDMTSEELDLLAEAEGVNPSKFESDEALAGAICEALGVKKIVPRRSPARDAPSEARPARGRGDDDDDARLARMRRGREESQRPGGRQRGD